MKMRTCFGFVVLALLVMGPAQAADLQQKYVGKKDCLPELQSAAGRSGIRLDKSLRAYLTAYRLKEAKILTIVQYQDEHEQCGVIRDVVQSRDIGSSFVWECVDPKAPDDIVVGTWPAKHPRVTGAATEAWRINLKELKFTPVKRPVNCHAGNYAGSDEGDGLSDWAKRRGAKCDPKRNYLVP